MFKHAGTEPWTANCLRWRPFCNCLLEHLVHLSFNTLYIVEYIHIHIRHTTHDTTSFPKKWACFAIRERTLIFHARFLSCVYPHTLHNAHAATIISCVISNRNNVSAIQPTRFYACSPIYVGTNSFTISCKSSSLSFALCCSFCRPSRNA